MLAADGDAAGAEAVGLLLRHKATSTMSTAVGGCLLHAAALARRADVLEAALGCLAAIGVDVNQQDAAGNTGIGAWFDDAIVSALGAEKADKVEGFLRVATGLTPIEESEYKVVVELDNYAYSFKIMNAGDLGKRILP